MGEEPSKTFDIGIAQFKCKCHTVIANLVPCDSVGHSTCTNNNYAVVKIIIDVNKIKL